jgi:hypothetical protein
MHAFARARRRRGTTVAASLAAVLATALTTVATVLPASTAHAAEPVTIGPAAGPVDPNTGYPFWYADGTGERFELCLDRPDSTPGLCLAAPQNPTARPWVDEDPARSNLAADPEAFWHSADADIRDGGTRARFVAAQEATFGGPSETATAGEQIAFGRVRVRLRGMVPGASYTVTQPYGTDTYVADGEGQVFVTEDIGCFDVPCDFTRSYDSSVTSFLRWDPAADRASVPATGPAELEPGYVGNPDVPHRVVGSPTGNNFFRVQGPAVGGRGVNVIETDLFSVQGKLWNPTQPMLGLDSTRNLVDFGKVMLGATAPLPAQTVTLTNAGGGQTPLQLQTLSVSGDDAGQFSIVDGTDTCSSASLAPGATCTVDVSYTPAATVGPVKAQLDVASTNGKDAEGGQRVLLHARVSDGTGKDARVTGPISPVHGFPQWYQDETGTRVALCDDQNDPMCVLPDVPEGTYDPTLPMSFPANFPSELFWWNADAGFDTTNVETFGDVSARLVLAEEAAFANDDPVPGDQIAFGRIRIRVDGLQLGGHYLVTTPYGDYEFDAEDDGTGVGEINYTEDIGCLETPCNFDRVNQSNIGPFLRQVNAPDGYLGNPGVEDQVTGGPNGNVFAISGPGVNDQTDLFAVSGKQLAGAAVGEVRVSDTTARVTAGQPASVTLTNISQAPATPQVSLPAGSGFTIVDNGCAGTLAPGATCTVSVGLDPQAPARPGATAELRVSNGTQPVIVVTVRRVGGGNAAPTAPVLAVASDTGISALDGLTRLGAVTVSGAAASGQPVLVSVDGTLATTVTAVSGTFSTQLILTEGRHEVTATYADGSPAAAATVRVDSSAPQVTEPRIDADVATGPLTGTIAWPGSDNATFTAQIRRVGGTFVPLALPRADATRVQHRLVSGDRYRVRVRGTDTAGNTSGWSATTMRASLVQERAERVRYDGPWTRHSVAPASGHRVRFSATRGATATIRTRVGTVEVLASTGPRRGRAAVLVDGRRVRTVDLYSAQARHRQTVATVNGLSPEQASVVQLRVLGAKRKASGGSGVTLDGFLLTR